ncbi:hypothetical protein [Nocardia sp. NPDC005745]|uniref:hypothetical protein n=1 Tax=Nocardia sp. NPDC005745 TaxID=3157061 RepID=UPI0033F4FD5B
MAFTQTAAHASPEIRSPGVEFRAALVDDAVVTTVADGHFAFDTATTTLLLRDDAGQILDRLPLSARVDGMPVGLAYQISDDGHTVRLRPDLTGVDRAAVRPVASALENQLATNDLINAVSVSTSVGTLIGTAIGAAIGIGIGVAVAGATCAAISVACVVAVLPVLSIGAAAGGVIGMIAVAGPSVAVALYDYVTTLNGAPGTSRYAPDLSRPATQR